MEQLNAVLYDFFASAEREFKLPEGALKAYWQNQTTDVKPKTDKKSKKSNYQKFFSQERARLMKENKDLSFGDVSKKVSQMWKNMTLEQRTKYTDDVPIEQNEKKTQIISALLQKSDNESIKIIHAKKTNKTGRSKLEIASKDEEEDDFFFNDNDQEQDDLPDEDDGMNAGDEDDEEMDFDEDED